MAEVGNGEGAEMWLDWGMILWKIDVDFREGMGYNENTIGRGRAAPTGVADHPLQITRPAHCVRRTRADYGRTNPTVNLSLPQHQVRQNAALTAPPWRGRMAGLNGGLGMKHITLTNTKSLADARDMFYDFPCRATAERYEAMAIAYAASMVIAIAELDEILSEVMEYLS